MFVTESCEGKRERIARTRSNKKTRFLNWLSNTVEETFQFLVRVFFFDNNR
jgi:hypothetical protein